MNLISKILISTLFFHSFCVVAQTELVKDYDYKYNVSNSNQILNLENRFGSMHIETTEGNQVIVKVTVTVIQRNEKRAEEVMSSITVKASETANLIGIYSKVGNDTNNKSGESFSVKFDVKMPKNMALEAKQSFGDMFVQNLNNKADISVKYGNLKAEEFTGFSKIVVEFGNGDVENITNGEVVVKYSNFDLQKGDKINLIQGFSDITIGQVRDLTLESKYGSIDIEDVATLTGSTDFSGFKIKRLQKKIDLNATYGGGIELRSVSKDFEEIKFTGKFTSFNIDLEQNINANLAVKTEFCNFKYSDVNTTFSSRIKDSNKGRYVGKIGKGGSLISIESSYGDIKLNY